MYVGVLLYDSEGGFDVNDLLIIGLARTIYIYTRCICGIFGRMTTKYTVIYGVYIGFWPTLLNYCPALRQQVYSIMEFLPYVVGFFFHASMA